MTYKDSTDDDIEGDVMDYSPASTSDLLTKPSGSKTVCSSIRRSPGSGTSPPASSARPTAKSEPAARRPSKAGWKSPRKIPDLLKLLDSVHEHEIPKPSGSYDSMMEYDERRLIKERLLGTIILTCLDQMLAVGALRGASTARFPKSMAIGPPGIRTSASSNAAS